MSERCKHGIHVENPCFECDEERPDDRSSLAPAPGSAGYRCNCGWRGVADQLSTVRGYRDRCPRCGGFAMSDRSRALINEIVEATPPNM